MKAGIPFFLFLIIGSVVLGQQKPPASKAGQQKAGARVDPVMGIPPSKMTMAQMKTAIEQSGNGPLYVKDVLKKKFKLDTIIVRRTWGFLGLADSLAFHGKVNKVYGPYDKGKFLVQILAKNPNMFNHIGQIFIDTSVFAPKVADSLGNVIMDKIRNGSTTFEEMAVIWSMGGEAATRGDIGWVAIGAMIPEIEKELRKKKKGDIFSVWTKAGLHIIRKTDDPEEKDGYALMMRIFLN
ncbi:PPIC-type PPIASE domain-containing protein [Pseudobacter ginsenosidimutans]|uniref:PPIC-type PPIASE domain-containing protein n=1 Tax=Pseudobacter ginsenosidimutans TaxID=661488 RepID=A0A4V2EZM2_9BACT|nr:PPIC-type PPIASE domain-containing protein [Pseudobacter ginsenosidimutans]